ncbi:MAG: hypothetical protein HQ549_02710 [Candidatus Omnitrophica bacterium]|nr:hypothetical protein [Candidatus Omnitrophota bacterium]
MKRNNKGFVIVLVLVVGAVLSIMVAAYSLSVLYRIQIATRYINSTKAYYLGSAGIEYMRYLYYTDPVNSPLSLTFSITPEGDDIINVRREKRDDVMIIEGEARINNVTRVVVCEEEHDPALYNLRRTYFTYGYPKDKARRMPIIKWK